MWPLWVDQCMKVRLIRPLVVDSWPCKDISDRTNIVHSLHAHAKSEQYWFCRRYPFYPRQQKHGYMYFPRFCCRLPTIISKLTFSNLRASKCKCIIASYGVTVTHCYILYNYWLQWGRHKDLSTRKSDNFPRPLGRGEYHF